MSFDIKINLNNVQDNTAANLENLSKAPASKTVNTQAINQTEEDELIECEINMSKSKDNSPKHEISKSESDTLRDKYMQTQNEYFRLKQELINLEQTKSSIKSRMNKKNSKKLQAQLSDATSKISSLKQNIQILENALQNLNTQIITAEIEEATAMLNSISIKPAENFKSNFAANSNLFYSNTPYSGESIPKDLANKLDSKLGAGFSQKCEDVAAKLNCNANDLLAMMYSESGLKPSVQGASGSVGLIQFMPSTLSANGYSSAQVAGMTGVQQLDVVEDILGKSKAMSGYGANDKMDAGTLYAICFLPAAAKNDVLCSNSGSLNWAYGANSGLDLNHDGAISKSDLASRLNGKYNEMLGAL